MFDVAVLAAEGAVADGEDAVGEIGDVAAAGKVVELDWTRGISTTASAHHPSEARLGIRSASMFGLGDQQDRKAFASGPVPQCLHYPEARRVARDVFGEVRDVVDDDDA